MSDLISRQAAIDALQKEINKGIPPFDDVMGSIRCGVRLARNIIEDLPSAQPKRMSNRKVSDRECPWCKAVCASTDKYCHECGWHIVDTPQTDCDKPIECEGCGEHICIGCEHQTKREDWRKEQRDCMNEVANFITGNND